MILAVRLDDANEKIADYFLFHSDELKGPNLRFSHSTQARMNAFRFPTLTALIEQLFARTETSEGYNPSVPSLTHLMAMNKPPEGMK